MLWSKQCSPKCIHSKEWRTTLLTLSSNREVNEVPKKSLLDDVDSGNEANLESEEDTPITFRANYSISK